MRRGRPSSKPRVPALDPHQEALAFTRECIEHCSSMIAMLLKPACAMKAPAEDELVQTVLYRHVLQLAEYAVHGIRPSRSVHALAAPLEQLIAGPLWDRIDIDGVVASADPQHETRAIKVVLAAAFARERLDEGKEVTSTQLALLAGMSRTGVREAIERGEIAVRIRGEPGVGGAVVSAAKARAWLARRGVAGFSAKGPTSLLVR